MASLSAGTVSLPVKPDTRGFGAILGKEILGSVEGVGKVASAAFAKTFGATTAVKLKEQNKVILASAADVERASMRVRVAQDAAVASDMKLKIADAQLAEARIKYAEGSSKVLRAEERLNTAQRAHATASAEVEAATARLVPVQGRLATEQGKLATMTERSHTALGRLGTGFRAVGSGVAKMAGPLAIASGVTIALGVEATKAAATFESATTRLVTDAGESAKNIGKVRDGLLGIAHDTGLSADEVAKGMYVVSSAGYTYANKGLAVMRAVAEGAKAGFADVNTVGDALTTVLTDFGKAAGTPAAAMSKLIATVSTGKTTMEALAGSLHSVLPAAASAHIGLEQVLGAVGTMTAEGISADQATQNLNHAILSLQNPTMVQTKAMAAMGLSSLDVAQKLGQRGLTGTLDLLEKSIMHNMGPAGTVLEKSFNQSKLAAQSADAMLKRLPPSLQSVAKEFLANKITSKEWAAALKEQPILTATLGRQFAVVAKNAHGFSDSLKSGNGPARTFAAELSRMTGGQVGLQVALHLTGEHMGTFVKNTKSIGAATSEAGGHVKGFAESQRTLNSQMAKLSSAWDVAAVKIGTKLIPVVIKAIPAFVKLADAFAKMAPAIGGAVGAIADFINKLAHGAKQWGDSFKTMNAGINALRTGFAHGAKQIGDAWNHTVKDWQHGAAQWNTAEKNVNKGMASLRSSFSHGASQIGSAWSSTVSKFRNGATQIGSASASMAAKFGHGASQMKAFFSGVVANFQHGAAQILGFFGKIASGASDAWKRVMAAFANGKRQILGFFSGASTWLYNAGASIIGGLARGISGAVGTATKAISGVLSKVRNFLPHSPAKEGPFSGKGWTLYSGQAIGEALATGMSSTTGKVRTAAHGMMSAASMGAPSVASLPGTGVASLPGRGQGAGAVQVVMPDTITVRDAKGFVATMEVVAADHVARYDLSRQLVSAR